MQTDWLLGVDEAGRAPLAGPVSVGVVAVPPGFDVKKEFAGVTDSKLLSAVKREKIFEKLEARVAAGDVKYKVNFTSHTYIDSFGITRAVRKAVWAGIRELAAPDECAVMLDGLLRAPNAYMQRTVIGGDLRVPVVSLASIAAKVLRDRLMERMAVKYPEYGFDAHKGYATREHRMAILTHGLTDIHRVSYCRGVLNLSVETSLDAKG